MNGSKMTSMSVDEMRTASAKRRSALHRVQEPTVKPYVWDGKDEDDRPLTQQEMQMGIENYRRRRGRPSGSNKASTTIRFDEDVLAAFRQGGPGWQTRINAALREWLTTHTTA